MIQDFTCHFNIALDFSESQLIDLLEILTNCLRNKWSISQSMYECDLGGHFDNAFHDWATESEYCPTKEESLQLMEIILEIQRQGLR